MCGRMAITLPHEAMVQLFDAQPDNDLPEVPNYNVCPTVQVHTVTSADGTRRLRPMRWGFVPRWYKTPGDGPLLINARAETVVEKPAFRDAVRETRCLVVASGFYEWTVTEEKAKLPRYITRADGAPLVMGAVWRQWHAPGSEEVLATCAVVTLAANDFMGRIHTRMPLVLAPEDWALWLGEAGKGAAALMVAAPEDALRMHRVDRAVNSNRATGPDLIAPIGD